MVFEGLDGLLCNVASMIMGGHELIFHAARFDLVFEVLRAFIVKDMQFGEDHGFCQSIDEHLVSAHHLSRCTVFHWLDENCIAVNFGEYHDILIAAARLFGKSPGLISVDFESGLVSDVVSGGKKCLFFAKGASTCVAFVGRNGLGGA